MLQAIRERLVGWILWVVIGIISVPFAFWGIESFRTGGGDPVVAKVGDEKITESELRRGYEQKYQQLQALMGENFRADQLDQNRFRGIVLQDMVSTSVLRQYAQEEGYGASDAMIYEAISGIPAFQRDGRFSVELYRERLSQQGYSPTRFEAQLREELAIDQMRRGVQESAFVTDAQVALRHRLAQQERGLAYALFEVGRYKAGMTPTGAQIEARYGEQKSRYLAPERIKLAYVELSLEALQKAADPGPDVLKALYEAEKAGRFSTPEERSARHILIGFGADKAASRKKAEGLLEQLKKGADFAGLARTNSEDPGSKDIGGSLGWVRRGQMVKGFEDALFDLGVNQISGVVETEFGYHLVRLDELRPAAVQPFAAPAVQEELLTLYRTREAERHFQEKQEQLEQLAFENPASLQPVADSLGLSIQTTDWLTRTSREGILASEDVRNAAFSEEVLKNGENSKLLAQGVGRVLVLRKAEYEAPRQRTMEEVSAQIADELKEEAARAKVRAEAAALLAALRGGAGFDEAAKKADVALRTPGLIRRDRSDINAQIVAELFRMPRTKDASAQYAEVTLADGDMAVIALTEVKDAAWPPADAQAASRTRTMLRDEVAGGEFGAYRAELEEGIRVKILRHPQAEPAESPLE